MRADQRDTLHRRMNVPLPNTRRRPRHLARFSQADVKRAIEAAAVNDKPQRPAVVAAP